MGVFTEVKVSGRLALPEGEKNYKTALVDADTLAYATCSVCEWGDDDVGYSIDMEHALREARVRVEELKLLTGCKTIELHFSEGKNFRHTLMEGYKANRASTRYPEGLNELKHMLVEEYPGAVHSEIEADDWVVFSKKLHPDDYILCAVDKDVLNAVEGTHFNYYRSVKYNIEPKWVAVTKEHAVRFPYWQCLVGDQADGLKGVPGIGAKGADKILGDETDETILWNLVVAEYEKKGLSEKDALTTMRMVNMHQLDENGKLFLFIPPIQ